MISCHIGKELFSTAQQILVTDLGEGLSAPERVSPHLTPVGSRSCMTGPYVDLCGSLHAVEAAPLPDTNRRPNDCWSCITAGNYFPQN